MEPKTLEALKASIAKWKKNATARTPDHYLTGWHDCPLCELFFHGDCFGCPVAEKTGMEECDGSPYGEAHIAWENWVLQASRENLAAAARTAARAEVNFLKTLLPTETS